MKIGAPFAGPVSFPLLVISEYEDIGLHNTCSEDGSFDVVLDSITNIAKYGMGIIAGVFIDMYSIIGNTDSKTIYTVRKGTLADYNARIIARSISGQVINTDPDTVVKMAEEGHMGLVGNEVQVGISYAEFAERLGIYAASCLIAARDQSFRSVLDQYQKGIEFIARNPEVSAEIISRKSNYYDEKTMKRIIGIYRHRLTTLRSDLERSISVYSAVEPSVYRLKILG
ncbi:DUF3834 domain-containing protein [Thermoplasma acidophilum]|uniref:DUF3834 domain-containing protein n=1 Tax=Thermoplasma acidophilum TaxID=2303 RepID=UPI00064E86B0|nr:DUF3834 domain-containing protein [Thermoplasma acidophilum]MCY0852291.1 DUF3834 domain-containing protein [Thermoplasma acidophilum]